MLVYTATKAEFIDDVRANRIEETIASAFVEKLGHRTSPSEVASWKNSMQYMQNVLLDSGIPEDAGVAIEYRVPLTAKRIDFILTGRDHESRETAVIVELKQWSEVTATDKDGIVETFLGGAQREVTHPSYQAWTYAALLEDYNEEIQTSGVQLSPCAYLHNLGDESVIRDARYSDHLDRAPVYLKQDSDRLARFIKSFVRQGDRGDLLYRIDKSRIRPSKNLADHLVSLLAGNVEFLMIDDQKLVYETVLSLSAAASDGRKRVLIVEGGPGTGKSVVAVNLLVELTRLGKTVQYVTRNAAPRTVYESKLAKTMTKTRITNLFKGSGSFINCEPDVFDCLLVDEAHRLNERSGMMQNLGVNQVKELIEASRVTVFFLDAHQQVTLKDIGSVSEIKLWADNAKAEVQRLELASQFRCNGSDGYLSWVDDVLQIEQTAVDSLDGIDFAFEVCESASELRSLILEKNIAANKARMVAGYCWPWASKKDPAATDIVLDGGDFSAQWNLNSDGLGWIVQPDSVDQVGCIHTCQGLELDHVGVIFGADLVVRDGRVVTNALERASQDSSVRGYKKQSREAPEAARQQADRIIKNTYRTLLTRGQKGCLVYSVDPETNEYFRARARRSQPEAPVSTEAGELRPFRTLLRSEVKPEVRAVPIYDLEVAAGVFSGLQTVETVEEYAELPDQFRVSDDLFVTQVAGESMNRRIPNGSWCLFKANPGGSRKGRVVLAQHRDISDPETGGRFAVKVYDSSSEIEDGERVGSVSLRPDSSLPGFEPLEFEAEALRELRIIAELVAVLG